MAFDFSGKRALVTGAGQGIGRALCHKLSECGAEVVALSKTKEHLESLKQQLPTIETVCVDVCDWEATRHAVERVVSNGKPVELLVNNAGMAILESFLEMTEESLDKVMTVNFKAVVNISQVVAKSLIERKKSGSIVHISSVASKLALVKHASYSASKAAVDMTAKVMALELGQHQIRVNCVNPTVVFTEMGRRNWSKPEKLQPLVSRIPLGRVAEVQDVVSTVLFLLSDHSSFINGATLPVEGGLMAVGDPVPHDDKDSATLRTETGKSVS